VTSGYKTPTAVVFPIGTRREKAGGLPQSGPCHEIRYIDLIVLRNCTWSTPSLCIKQFEIFNSCLPWPVFFAPWECAGEGRRDVLGSVRLANSVPFHLRRDGRGAAIPASYGRDEKASDQTVIVCTVISKMKHYSFLKFASDDCAASIDRTAKLHLYVKFSFTSPQKSATPPILRDRVN
jgi:hypothetical protein